VFFKEKTITARGKIFPKINEANDIVGAFHPSVYRSLKILSSRLPTERIA